MLPKDASQSQCLPAEILVQRMRGVDRRGPLLDLVKPIAVRGSRYPEDGGHDVLRWVRQSLTAQVGIRRLEDVMFAQTLEAGGEPVRIQQDRGQQRRLQRRQKIAVRACGGFARLHCFQRVPCTVPHANTRTDSRRAEDGTMTPRARIRAPSCDLTRPSLSSEPLPALG